MGIATNARIKIVKRGRTVVSGIAVVPTTDMDVREISIRELFRNHNGYGVALLNRLYDEFYPELEVGVPANVMATELASLLPLKNPPAAGDPDAVKRISYVPTISEFDILVKSLEQMCAKLSTHNKKLKYHWNPDSFGIHIPLNKKHVLNIGYAEGTDSLAPAVVAGFQNSTEVEKNSGTYQSWIRLCVPETDHYSIPQMFVDGKQVASAVELKFLRLFYWALLEDRQLLEYLLKYLAKNR